MGKRKVIVSVINDLSTDQRVHKMCSFIVSQGYEVTLVGRQKKDSLPLDTRNYRTKRFRLPVEKGALFYALFNLRLFVYLLPRKYHILVANDLDTLLPNYLLSKWKRCSLVYDSHEYFTEVPELIARPRIKAIWEKLEQSMFPKLKQVITVNSSIAAKYQQKYGVTLKVVRNISPKWNDSTIPSKKELGIPEDTFLLIMQGAGLNIDRGVEQAIAMMPLLQNVVLLIVGDGDVIPEMKKRVIEQHLSDRVRFYGKRPYRELLHFTYHAHLGLSFDQPTNPNYQFSLPNKIFDYIHTGTPILSSNVVEVATVINTYTIGKVIDDFSPAALAQIIREIQGNPELLKLWKTNCMLAAQQENWEQEVQQLTEFYPKVAH